MAGDAALLVDPEDVDALTESFRRLHDEPYLREDLGRRGRERATDESFSWQRAARQTLAAYRDDREAFLAEPQPLGKSQLSTPAVLRR